jgi:hypothetical protein
VLPSTYSRRKRQALGGHVDVYEYDKIPLKLRIQIVHILSDAIGEYKVDTFGADSKACYDFIVDDLKREFGVFRLRTDVSVDSRQELFGWFQSEPDVDRWLDGYEASLRLVDRFIRADWERFQHAVRVKPDTALALANARFQEAAIGYQYVSGDIVKIDSSLVHRDIVVPALGLLRDPRFSAAEQEYLDAHEAYRHGKLEDCIVACAKSFESVMKVIGAKRHWAIKESDQASRLIQAAVDAGFLATYSQASMNHLKGLMESSAPTVRNKQGGHGAGATPRAVPNHLAAFQLHQTAAVILFLVEQDSAIP